MFTGFFSTMLLLYCIQANEHIQFSIGPNYSSYQLFQDSSATQGKWHWGGEIGTINIIPNIGMKIRAAKLSYEVEQGAYTYEYTPLTLCTSFNLLPFLKIDWLTLSGETGFGVYFWRKLHENEVVVLPTGKVDEKDLGFVAGATLLIKPIRFIGLEFITRYNYIASADINKYGYSDKDEKIWENGLGLKIILP